MTAAAAPPPSPTIYDNARPLLYNVSPWNGLGFGVPNFGRQITTLNLPIWRLADDVATNQLAIMTSADAKRQQYPSVNTIMALARLVNRAQAVLAGRQKQPNDVRLSPLHATPDLLLWNIHPVPYFTGPMVRNAWLREFNSLCMVALTNIYRHSDNDEALTVTSDFASQIWPYFREIKILVCTELLGMTQAQAEDDTQPMPAGPYNGPGTQNATTVTLTPTGPSAANATAPTYNPPATVVNTERLFTPGALQSLPGTDDLLPFTVGIPANLIVPNLVQYPVGPIPGETGLAGEMTPGYAALAGLAAISQGPGGSMGAPGGVTPAAQAVADAISAAIHGGAASTGAAAPAAAQVSGVTIPPLPSA
ncbi:MAG TPA: hypothetical protein VJ783_03260 [Pirellulales bacterium]|nr:hypothetical protein [Pirellulales bacterium]